MPGVNHTLDDNIADNREQRVGELMREGEKSIHADISYPHQARG